jgi:penicillin amidase
VAWTGALPGDGIGGLLRAAHAPSAASFRSALGAHFEPVLAFVFADDAGAGGMQIAGGVPRRGADTGLAPAPARGEEFAWHGTLPFEALPFEALGATWLVAADRPPERPGAVRGEWLWRPGVRAARIQELLRSESQRGPLALRQIAAIQTDVTAPGAPSLVRDVLALAGDPSALGAEAREVASLLSEWDGRAGADSVGAALYYAFLERLVHDALEARLGAELAARYLALPQAHPVHVVTELVAAAAGRTDGAAEDAERARLVEIIGRSLRETWLWLSVHSGPNREKWNWGRLHPVTFRPLGPFALLGPPPAALGPFPVGGSDDTVACAEYDRRAPFDVRVASTWRLAIDADQLDQGLTSLAPGESEHFDHPHASDGIERWLAGQPRLLVASPLLIDETTRARLVLEPASAPATPR